MLNELSFGHEEVFYFLWVPFLLTVLMVYSLRKRFKRQGRLFSASLGNRIFQPEKKKREKISALIWGISLFLLFGALLAPRYGYDWVEVKRKGVDIMLAVDLSSSMLAEDVSPNRLIRAKYKIYDLLDMMEGDRVGLVIFAGDAFVQCPLTLDYETLRMFLEGIDTELIPVQGTAISGAIRKSMTAFNSKEETTRVVILITDGEDTVENPLLAAEEAKEKGVRIYSIGIGGKEGVPIPDLQKGGFKKDSTGNMVLTSLNPVQLQNIAEITGGKAVVSSTGNFDLKSIYLDEIKHLDQTEFKESRKKEWRERYQWFLFPAVLLLIYEFLYLRRREEA